MVEAIGEEKTLFNISDLNEIKSEDVKKESFSNQDEINVNSVSETQKKVKNNLQSSSLNGSKNAEFFATKPTKKHTDAADRSTNFGVSLPSNQKDFGTYKPQSVDNLKADNCIHDVCYPPDWDIEKSRRELSTPLPPREPAKTYKFALDSFQKRAINCIERHHNVLVAAHTSAGKTSVAEYAIAKSIKEKTRVIYTSPIKALSNQKYRDLYHEFTDVGLITGDVTINSSASVLIMTTEILRNMLYRGSETIREVSWVIFDEIHYMRDKTRGVIYEECLILLPQITKFIFLSATIPNAAEFACWVSKLNNSPCHVVYTEKRPIPLNHYVTPQGGSGLVLIMDEKNEFKEENFVKAVNSIKDENFRSNNTSRKRKRITGEEDLFKVVKLIMAKKNYPAIIFSFSRRDCETNALFMSKLDFNQDQEKKNIELIFKNAIDSLSAEDKKLAQVTSILPILKRGIGIHHSGLLPILKEITEILFQEGLIKCLFATETFAMGVNMPAKTVVYTNTRKFDGTDTRNITSGEYIQMSGRAGRRGIDEKGLVIVMLSQKIESSVAKKMMQGTADKLDSSFALGYNMLLNLLRVEGSDPEYMIAHSFRQFQLSGKTPILIKQLEELKYSLAQINIEDEERVSKLFKIKSRFDSLNKEVKEIRNRPQNILPFLNGGRLISIVDEKGHLKWGIVLEFEKILTSELLSKGIGNKEESNTKFTYVIKIYFQKSEERYFTFKEIENLSSIRVYMPENLSNEKAKEKLTQSIEKVFQKYEDGNLPCLCPVDHMNIKGKMFSKSVKKLEKVREKYLSCPLLKDSKICSQIPLFAEKDRLNKQIKETEESLTEAVGNNAIRNKLSSMRNVLKRLGHITKENVVNIKGRVACDISTADELLATELLFSGCFNDLSAEQIVSVCSCLIDGERNLEAIRLKAELAEPFFRLKKAAQKVASVIKDERIDIDPIKFVEAFKPDMMEVVFAWVKGTKFAEICKMTTAFEGSVIRVIRRLGELLGEFYLACKIIGNEELGEKFKKGTELIRRDIVFAASLYL